MLGRTQSEHQKQTVSKALQGNKHGAGHIVTPEHKAILAAARRSKPGTNTGKKFSDEHRRKISEGLKGRVLSEVSKAKIRAARLKQVIPLVDTLPERLMQEELTRRGFVFEKHKPIDGQPDIFLQPNFCVFVDGNYWHNLPGAAKRDRITGHILRRKGYRVIRFWEKDIKASVAGVVDKLVRRMGATWPDTSSETSAG